MSFIFALAAVARVEFSVSIGCWYWVRWLLVNVTTHFVVNGFFVSLLNCMSGGGVLIIFSKVLLIASGCFVCVK